MFKRSGYILTLFLLLAGLCGWSFAQDEGTSVPAIHGRLQTLGIVEFPGINNTNRNPANIYLFLKQARLMVTGKLNTVEYDVQVAFGGEEIPNGANSVFSLQDYNVTIPFLDTMGVKVGQFVVPFGRERLTDEGKLLSVNLSMNNLFFNIGRETGIAVFGKVGPIQAAAGTFIGAGMDIPIRYIPQLLGFPMVVFRVGYNTLDESIFKVTQLPQEVDGIKMAFCVSGMYEQDSRVGHNSVMGQKKTDQPLILNPLWNPYLKAYVASQYPLSKLYQLEADAAFAMNVGDIKITGLIEGNWAKFDNIFTNGHRANAAASNARISGSVEYAGATAQVAAAMGKFQIGVRYAIIFPDGRDFGYQATATNFISRFIDSRPIHELTPSLTFVINDNVKIVGEAQACFDVPVAHEAKLGTYNLLNQPGQIALITSAANGNGARFMRSSSLTARLMLQATF